MRATGKDGGRCRFAVVQAGGCDSRPVGGFAARRAGARRRAGQG